MNLQALQSDFQNIVLGAECRGADWVSQSTHSLSSQQRLAIYHNAYRVRLIDVLLDTFEHTAVYLGDDWFEQLARDYVQNHHSVHNNIGQYGEAFPAYLATQLPNDLEVAELAHMDWTLRRAFDGADSSVMTQAHLQQIANGQRTLERLQAVATLSLSTQRFNTLDIWQAINQEEEQAPAVKKLAEPVTLMVWRKGHSPHFQSLPSVEAAAVARLLDGTTLEAIGEVIAQAQPEADAANELGLMLHRWIDEQMLTLDERTGTQSLAR